METDRPDHLEELLQLCWDYLEEGAGSARSPFHTAVLGTVEHGEPRLRTVVLRAAEREAGHVLCHTDVRSAKVRQIGDDAPVSWLLYDPARKVQLRLEGRARVHADDALATERWRASAAGSRRCYLVEPGPGAVLESAVSTLPQGLRRRRPEPEETEPGRGNFAVVAAAIEFIDWLHLTADGHRRARFRRVGRARHRGDGRGHDHGHDCGHGWAGDWIAP
ncbi:pyridoxamine 5'-phosphate oxidase family protein [Lentisalinibacter sediminis]|uniref:pyridoxamine 5'-phosphate oxidase family protein n=1 Tax=Lentisalinibacter sediminis TaxID=2992237 RepID=UPI0038688F55